MSIHIGRNTCEWLEKVLSLAMHFNNFFTLFNIREQISGWWQAYGYMQSTSMQALWDGLAWFGWLGF